MEEQQHRNALPRGFLLNEYIIESVLGKPGGFGITYLAKDTNLDQLVAIKEYLPTDFAMREGTTHIVHVQSTSYEDSFKWGLDCFMDEARVLAKFNHHTIVKVLRYFKANGTAYMVMEYQQGESLEEYLAKKRILTEQELLKIVLPLLDGLIEIHNTGFLHRDIKPNNIYIRHDNSPILLDFGSARYAIGQKSRTVTSIVTPGYAPLEQYDNEIRDQGPWTDIYALGAVMYYAINGNPPPAATRRVMKDPMESAYNIGEGKYKFNLLKAIDWALELNEENRPQSIELWREKMLTSSPPAQIFSPRSWTVITTPSLILNLLLLMIVVYFGYENYTLQTHQKQAIEHAQSEAQAAIERALKDADMKSASAQNIRLKAEAELKKEQTRREKAEINYMRARGLIQKIQSFEALPVEKLSGFEDDKKYYEITGVKIYDVLNVREFPGHLNKKVVEIPATERCIEFLGHYRLLKSQIWVKIQYNQIPGWVNSTYLVENKDCKAEESS